MIPYFKAYLIKHEKIVDVREINYNLLEIGWRDDDFHDIVSSFDDIKFIQSIGLKDKHGVEIYDKDILRDSYGDVFLIEWLESCFILTESYGDYDHSFLDDLSFYEVVGNQFEHPHLLEED